MVPVFLAFLGALAAFAVVACWDEIIAWLSDLVIELKKAYEEFKRNVLHAAAVFVQRVGEALINISHVLYYKENGQWIEKTTTRQLNNEDELPPSIKAKLYGNKKEEITEEMEKELQMTI